MCIRDRVTAPATNRLVKRAATARELYVKAWHELRVERRYWREDWHSDVYSFGEVVDFRIQEKRLDAITLAAHVSLNTRWSDDIEDRLSAQRNQVAFGAVYM